MKIIKVCDFFPHQFSFQMIQYSKILWYKKLYEWAVSRMKDRSGNRIPVMSKEQVSEFLSARGVKLKNDKGHDAAYVLAMAKADYYGSTIIDEPRLALFVRDFLDDVDGSKTKAFDHFVVDCWAMDEPIFWDEMI